MIDFLGIKQLRYSYKIVTDLTDVKFRRRLLAYEGVPFRNIITNIIRYLTRILFRNVAAFYICKYHD